MKRWPILYVLKMANLSTWPANIIEIYATSELCLTELGSWWLKIYLESRWIQWIRQIKHFYKLSSAISSFPNPFKVDWWPGNLCHKAYHGKYGERGRVRDTSNLHWTFWKSGHYNRQPNSTTPFPRVTCRTDETWPCVTCRADETCPCVTWRADETWPCVTWRADETWPCVTCRADETCARWVYICTRYLIVYTRISYTYIIVTLRNTRLCITDLWTLD